MGTQTGISWTDGTINFWKGCTKVSPACANCYMYRDAGVYGWDPTVVTRCKGIWKDILNPKKFKPGHRYFVSSWTDFWHRVADQWRGEAYDLLRQRSDIIIQFLTKRIERVPDHLPPDWPWTNAWLGVTAEDQEWWDKRVPLLLDIPAAVHFVSCGPTLGLIKAHMTYVKLRQTVRGDWPIGHHVVAAPGIYPASVNPHGAVSAILPDGQLGIKPSEYEWVRKLDLVITEGESGPRARPSHTDWFRSIRDQCLAAGVAYHHKQNGEWAELPEPFRYSPAIGSGHREYIMALRKYASEHGASKLVDYRTEGWAAADVQNGMAILNGEKAIGRVGTNRAGRLLDGMLWDQMPEGW